MCCPVLNKKITKNLNQDVLSQSKYFRERIEKLSDNNAALIVVELKSIKLLDSYLLALNALTSNDKSHSADFDHDDEVEKKEKTFVQEEPRIDIDNMFDILIAAHTLNMPRLVVRCTDFIGFHLTPQLLCTAVKVAMDTDSTVLLGVIYNWIKSCSPLSLCENSSAEDGKKKVRRSSLKIKKDVVAKDKLFFSSLTMSIVYENNHLAVALFDKVVEQELKRYESFFRAGAFTSKNDAIPMGTPELEKRNGFMGTTRFDLRRTRGRSYRTLDGKNRKFVQFDLYTHVESDDDDDDDDERDSDDEKKSVKKKKNTKEKSIYVMSARMYEDEGYRNFVLSSKRDGDFVAYGTNCVGGVIPNMLGTTFTVVDSGMAFNSKIDVNMLPSKGYARREICAVQYDMNIMGRVPNSMQIYVPRKSERVYSMEKHRKTRNGVYACRTRKPKWSDRNQSWTMDFRGRCKVASKKNFLIVCDDIKDSDQVLLLFGKMKKDMFSLDFRAPFSVAAALGSVLPSFAKKLAVT